MKQGDPISPHLFYLAKYVLSKAILNLRNDGMLNYISSPQGNLALSHAFCDDDLIICCKADMRSV